MLLFLVLLLAFLSGFSALVYEIVWQRQLTHLLGATLYSVSAIYAIFLGGLCVGAFVGGKFVDRIQVAEHALQAYAIVEFLIGMSALCSTILQANSWQLIGSIASGDESSLVLRSIWGAVLLAVPCILMGATYPFLSKIAGGCTQTVEQGPGLVYAVNNCGAVSGAIVSAFIFMPSEGLQASAFLASAINIFVASIAILAGRNKAWTSQCKDLSETESRNPNNIEGKQPERIVLALAFLFGFLALAMEVAFTRFFTLMLGSSIYSVSCVLTVFLIGITCGSLLCLRFLKWLTHPFVAMALGCVVAATSVVVFLYCVNEVPLGAVQILGQSGQNFFLAVCARMLLVSTGVFVPAVCSGMFFVLSVRAFRMGRATLGMASSLVYGFNTAGGIVGSLVTGFVLIPYFGMIAASGIQTVLLLSALTYVVLGLVTFWLWLKVFIDDRESRYVMFGIVAFLTLVSVGDLAIFRPQWNQTLMSIGPMFLASETTDKVDRRQLLAAIMNERQNKLLFYREGVNTTVSVARNHKNNVVSLRNDGKVEGAVPINPIQQSRGSDVNTQVLLGTLPLLWTKTDPETILLIGHGTGTTAGTILNFPQVKQLTIAEIEPSILEADRFFNSVNNSPLREEWRSGGRVKVRKNDARFVLSSSRALFDVIVSQPADPWVNGASELFSLDFWKIARTHLVAGGAFCQWIQMYSITPQDFGILCRTFKAVFPNAWLFHNKAAGECLLIGINDDGTQTAPRQFVTERLTTPAQAQWLSFAGIRSPIDLLSITRLEPAQLAALCSRLQGADGPELNTDDNMRVEFRTAQAAFEQQQHIAEIDRLIDDFAKATHQGDLEHSTKPNNN